MRSPAGQRTLGIAGAALTEGASLLADARELLLQGMNGTLSEDDRASIAVEFDLIRSELIEIANERAGEIYVFGGTETGSPPWQEIADGGSKRVVYRGNDESLSVRVGMAIDAEITLPGLSAFGQFDPSGVLFGGLTGAASGTTADEGTGFGTLEFRHDSTDAGNLASVGIALANGGANDTILSSNAVTVDATAGTVQLGSGKPISLAEANGGILVVENELGGELHLDVSGFTGVDYSGHGDGRRFRIPGRHDVRTADLRRDRSRAPGSGSGTHRSRRRDCREASGERDDRVRRDPRTCSTSCRPSRTKCATRKGWTRTSFSRTSATD